MALAEQTSAALGAKNARPGAQVAARASAGRDLSKYHLRYLHFGRAYKTPEGPWRASCNGRNWHRRRWCWR